MDVVGKTPWQITFEWLKENNFDVYPPATKKGECLNPYIVLEEGGSYQARDYSSEYVYYKVNLYVPQAKYSYLSQYEDEVKRCLAKWPVYPMLMPTGQNEPDYFDDNINAHLRIVMYRNVRRNKHL